MFKLLLTRPAYETTTKYLFAWNQKVVVAAKVKNITTINLQRKDATKSNLINALSKNNPEYVFLNGHGAPDLITGHNSETLIQAGINEQVLAKRIVYALSCETGKILGPAAVEKGAKSYIGYDEPFVFVTTKGKETKPTGDSQAAFFLDPAIQVSLSLLDGDSPKNAHRKSQKAYLKNIQTLASFGKKESYLIRYLVWDMKHQVLIE